MRYLLWGCCSPYLDANMKDILQWVLERLEEPTTKSASDFLEAVVEINLRLATILGGDSLASLENMAEVAEQKVFPLRGWDETIRR